MAVSIIGLAGIVLAAAALGAWINARILNLPAAVGLLVIGLAGALGVYAADAFIPAWGAGPALDWLFGRIDYSKLVLDFLLAYLLFAGALNVDVGALRRRGWAVAVLATLGTVVTAGLVAGAFWAVAGLIGVDLPFAWAVVFGILISPTDPIAVLAMTKRTALQPELRAQIEGEALFNDGVAVVLFRAALAYAVAQGAGDMNLGHLGFGVLEEALGGAALGFAVALVAVGVVRLVDDWATETLVTVAVATSVYGLALYLHLSGPIGVVTAGLVCGSQWMDKGMSQRTRTYLHPFWHVVEEAMNAVLFFLAGLTLHTFLKVWDPRLAVAVAAAPAIVLVARWIAIAIPSAGLPLFRRKASATLTSVLTWAGVRGGLSLAMALSLPDNAYRPIILAGSFGVVLFSMVVQSMTMEMLAVRTGYGEPRTDPEPTH